ncbi:ABC transporter permease [Vallitalea longa]|uniref:ABC transporter permease n=1 Tax=Vallitalea longa TaxID=2936439 RepID=A0A9W5YEH9_9FIRM|nr:sugar ABC transporter permease [Vallitalea longa]GKX31196.1 ABC transporter permease [Vallitalea longa]
MKKSKKIFWLFLAPSGISFLLVVIIPMFLGIYYSFTDWNGISEKINFVGFTNYIKIFTKDPGFRDAFIFTVKYVVVEVIIVNVAGFLLALLVTKKLRVSNFLKSTFFLPNLVGGLLLGFIWQFIFTKGFESIADNLGWAFFDGWLSTPQTGFWGLIIVCSWQSIGYMMLIYVAGLQSIPQDVWEAGSIDGATGFKKFRYITLPLIVPAITIGIFMNISGAFKVFDQNLALTNGGPHNSTQMLTLNLYNTAYTYNELGVAQAKAIIFLVIVGIITFTQLYFTKKKEVEM